MKKIKDERLILRNLQNTKIAHIVQTIGVLCILGYNFFQGGSEAVFENPLWVVLMLTTIIYGYLSMGLSIEHEKKIKNPRKSFTISLTVLVILALAVGYFVSITPDFDWLNGLFFGTLAFICGFIPFYYIYRLRVKQKIEFEDE